MNKTSMTLPRVMLAAPHGKSGKTVIVTGILRALNNSGVDVAPFKKGADYIDPGWHSFAARSTSRNLDCVFMDHETIRQVLVEDTNPNSLAILEGAMGLFDGSDLEGTSSSAEVAKVTDTPVVLIVDTNRMTRSVAAIVLGCINFDPDLNICGVILNRVNGKRHERRIREAIEHYCKIPVIGAIPNTPLLAVHQHDVGLESCDNFDKADEFIDMVADVIKQNVDLDALIGIANEAPSLEINSDFQMYPSFEENDQERIKIGVIRDKVFNFYYEENLKALKLAGADIVYVDSLQDSALPNDINALYIGGGFPEFFAQDLARNKAFLEAVKTSLQAGLPCFVEGTSVIYLGNTFTNDGISYTMTGAMDISFEKVIERQGHGYSIGTVTKDHPWLSEGVKLIGHSHHYLKMSEYPDSYKFGVINTRGAGLEGKNDALSFNQTVASVTHINAIASPEWAPGFVQAARDFKANR